MVHGVVIGRLQHHGGGAAVRCRGEAGAAHRAWVPGPVDPAPPDVHHEHHVVRHPSTTLALPLVLTQVLTLVLPLVRTLVLTIVLTEYQPSAN